MSELLKTSQRIRGLCLRLLGGGGGISTSNDEGLRNADDLFVCIVMDEIGIGGVFITITLHYILGSNCCSHCFPDFYIFVVVISAKF